MQQHGAKGGGRLIEDQKHLRSDVLFLALSCPLGGNVESRLSDGFLGGTNAHANRSKHARGMLLTEDRLGVQELRTGLGAWVALATLRSPTSGPICMRATQASVISILRGEHLWPNIVR